MKISGHGSHSVICLLASACVLTGCVSHKDEPRQEGSIKRVVLLYAVASNNLYSNLQSDKSEIIEAAKDIDLSGLSMLVYQVTPTGNPELLELTKDNTGACEFVQVKEYSRDLYSTDPVRISEVMEDVRHLRESENYGLILWSHGTGIDPSFSTHGNNPVLSVASERDVTSIEYITAENVPGLYSFGSDRDMDKNASYYDETDIDELAAAIPDGMFDFIWFDACYMSGIETIYQLRNKCDYFVGYPTEVYTPGMPYDQTIPYILRETPDLKGAAEKFFNYYAQHQASSYRVATVAVADMGEIEKVAEYCRAAYADATVPSVAGLQKYSRNSFGPFYDFAQYTRLMAESSPSAPDVRGFEEAMERFIIYKAATEKDFNFNPISPENYSGISCYRFWEGDSSEKALYYHTLDWYNRVYPGLGK